MSGLISSVKPGLLHGERPEREAAKAQSAFDRSFAHFAGCLRKSQLSERSFMTTLAAIEREQRSIAALDEVERGDLRIKLHRILRKDGLLSDSVIPLIALIRQCIVDEMEINPHPAQLYAGWAMLHGCVAEMQTGEGKSLTAAFPAIVMAMTGSPVHVITVNEYLAQRDAENLSLIYRKFGLSCSCVTSSMDTREKRDAYRADIVYCTNKQVVFDYLRDSLNLAAHKGELAECFRSLVTLKPSPSVQRGLGFAIIDEADSVLIDDARVPLILAEARKTDNKEIVEASLALSIASTLSEGVDYVLNSDAQPIELTESGNKTISDMTQQLQGVWRIDRYRRELLIQALTALYKFQLDRDYLIRDGKVELIDGSTGRTLTDRKLQHGLHRMLELKEKCDVTDSNNVLAGMSFQSFFQRYCHLSGMSGTLHEVRRELRHVYGLKVIKVSPHKAVKRKDFGIRIFSDDKQQFDFALMDIKQRHLSGQPVLLGARTLELSERLSALLTEHGIEHELLNARQDSTESDIIKSAGIYGAVTVATNMAGRGTDITLGHGVARLGGLHVVNFSLNDSSRVDRQLFGRSARQGDPGSCQALLSLRDQVVAQFVSSWIIDGVSRFSQRWPYAGQPLMRSLIRFSQFRRERWDSKQRIEAFRRWPKIKRQLGYTGDMECGL